jgi:hypothetical protein
MVTTNLIAANGPRFDVTGEQRGWSKEQLCGAADRVKPPCTFVCATSFPRFNAPHNAPFHLPLASGETYADSHNLDNLKAQTHPH